MVRVGDEGQAHLALLTETQRGRPPLRPGHRKGKFVTHDSAFMERPVTQEVSTSLPRGPGVGLGDSGCGGDGDRRFEASLPEPQTQTAPLQVCWGKWAFGCGRPWKGLPGDVAHCPETSDVGRG